MWGERETTSDHLQTIYVTTLIKKLKSMQTPDRQYYAIVTVITEMSSSLLYSIVCPSWHCNHLMCILQYIIQK